MICSKNIGRLTLVVLVCYRHESGTGSGTEDSRVTAETAASGRTVPWEGGGRTRLDPAARYVNLPSVS